MDSYLLWSPRLLTFSSGWYISLKCWAGLWVSYLCGAPLRTWVWVNSRSWWWTGKSGVLWFMGLQRVGHDWATELNLCTHMSTSKFFFPPINLFFSEGRSQQKTKKGKGKIIFPSLHSAKGFPGGSVVKGPLPMQERWVRSIGWEDPLEKEMATYSSILAWEIPWTEEPGGLQSMESQTSWTRLSD